MYKTYILETLHVQYINTLLYEMELTKTLGTVPNICTRKRTKTNMCKILEHSFMTWIVTNIYIYVELCTSLFDAEYLRNLLFGF